MSTLLGLIRDAVVAIIGVIILAGVEVSDEFIAGILLLVTTLFALGSWAWETYKGGKKA